MVYLTPYFKVGHNLVILSHGALIYIYYAHITTQSHWAVGVRLEETGGNYQQLHIGRLTSVRTD